MREGLQAFLRSFAVGVIVLVMAGIVTYPVYAASEGAEPSMTAAESSDAESNTETTGSTEKKEIGVDGANGHESAGNGNNQTSPAPVVSEDTTENGATESEAGDGSAPEEAESGESGPETSGESSLPEDGQEEGSQSSSAAEEIPGSSSSPGDTSPAPTQEPADMAEDIHVIRECVEFIVYGAIPIGVAALIIGLLCRWFYCTFIRGTLD